MDHELWAKMTQQALIKSPPLKQAPFNIQTIDQLASNYSNLPLVEKFQFMIDGQAPSTIFKIYSLAVQNTNTFDTWIKELGKGDDTFEKAFKHVLANCELKIYHEVFTLQHRASLKMSPLRKSLDNNIENLWILQNFMVQKNGYVRKLILEEQPRESVNGILETGLYHELSKNKIAVQWKKVP
ncbi:unnamed protein product [Ambrosiozyma monospora]|uniref:Unnamed protein product n=1 Tax=Ambrosiozyma monospora TaxID=43982 RepID=A0ACB5T5N7_AMBMO|nr:unnamed protein product [Ambrosiozyma monospora]